MEVARTITIDGVGFPVEFRGWHADLEVAEPPGRLRPWRLAAHAAALAACSDGEGLNAAQFADRVLESCWIGTGPGPRALALWWAAGAEPVEEDELEFGDVRVSLRRWSFGDRIRALEQAGALQPQPALDMERWLLARVAGCVRSIRPPVSVGVLPAAPLLASLDQLDVPPDGLSLATLPARLRESLQRACRTLGWTPSQVLAAPAAEIDRVLELFDEAVAPSPVRPAPLQGLAALPGAVVFQFEPDEDV